VLEVVERHPSYRWLAVGFNLKGIVTLAVASVIFGWLGHVKALYIFVAALFAIACALAAVNQFTIRQGFKLRDGSGVSIAPETSAYTTKVNSHKQRATLTELSQPKIVNRLVLITEVPHEADDWIRHKTFVDCDIQDPAIVVLSKCTLKAPINLTVA
jgi:hypothetical protein